MSGKSRVQIRYVIQQREAQGRWKTHEKHLNAASAKFKAKWLNEEGKGCNVTYRVVEIQTRIL